jgi:hypothetical protein
VPHVREASERVRQRRCSGSGSGARSCASHAPALYAWLSNRFLSTNGRYCLVTRRSGTSALRGRDCDLTVARGQPQADGLRAGGRLLRSAPMPQQCAQDRPGLLPRPAQPPPSHRPAPASHRPAQPSPAHTLRAARSRPSHTLASVRAARGPGARWVLSAACADAVPRIDPRLGQLCSQADGAADCRLGTSLSRARERGSTAHHLDGIQVAIGGCVLGEAPLARSGAGTPGRFR